ncbi:MAG: hypothetical protein C4K49_07235 [Candidatus Thorarchaeota archaeon]|nr:MAG: hypothetical protein C4K49_07235 [Candidatus Thorarchaeota archaeon]
MRILHVCDSLNPSGVGGYESYLHYLSRALESQGHESFIVTQPPGTNSPESVKRPYYTLFHLPGNLLEARKWDFLSLPEEERAKAAGRIFRQDDVASDVEILAGQLNSLVHDISPDIIHAHSTYVVFNRVIEKLRKNRLVNVPVLATIHGLPKALVLPNGEKTTDYRQLAESCPFDRIIAVSRAVEVALQAHLSKRLRKRVNVLYLGVDLSIFQPQTGLKRKWDLGFFGRLERMKAVDLFPEMLSALKPHFPDIRLVITGDGSIRREVFNDFGRMNVIEQVDYLGVVPIDRIPSLMNSIRVFLYPSREEPFGLSVIEAMACGVPVITSNIHGPSEIVTHAYDGFTVSPGDVDELTKAVRRIMSDFALRVKLGKNARNTVEKRFDLQKHSMLLLQLYQNLQSAVSFAAETDPQRR